MIVNPYIGPSPGRADAWGQGFLAGFSDVSIPIEAPEKIAVDDGTAYSEGVQAGRQSAIDGIAGADACVSAAEPSPGEEIGHLVSGLELLHAVWEMKTLATLAGGLVGLVVVLVEVGSSAKHTLPPEQVLPELATPLIDTLNDYGLSSLEVFCGVGVDALAEGCELKLSGFYPSLDDARAAAVAMKRPEWLVVSWRTDQCASFKIVESSNG
jgi:hypothetical protein